MACQSIMQAYIAWVLAKYAARFSKAAGMVRSMLKQTASRVRTRGWTYLDHHQKRYLKIDRSHIFLKRMMTPETRFETAAVGFAADLATDAAACAEIVAASMAQQNAIVAMRAHVAGDATLLSHVECLIKKGPSRGCEESLNKQGPCGLTPMLVACLQGNAAVVAALLQAGADPAAEGDVWVTQKDDDVSDLNATGNPFGGTITIISYGASVIQNRFDDRLARKCKEFPLNLAVREGYTAIVELLLARDEVDVNQAASDSGCTALLEAADRSKLDVMKLLLAQDAIEVNKANKYGTTALYSVCSNGDAHATKLLLDQTGIEVNKATDDPDGSGGETPLYAACYGGYVDVVKLLLAQDGIELNKARTGDFAGWTPLYSVCSQLSPGWGDRSGHVEVIKLLLAQDGIDVNGGTNDAGSYSGVPLHSACFSDHVEVIKLLLAQDGIELNIFEDHDFYAPTTPLYVACKNGCVEAMKLLLAQDSIDVNKGNTSGATPLYAACNQSNPQAGHVDAIKLLLAHDAIEMNAAKTDDGATPLFALCEQGHVEAIKLLLAHDSIAINAAKTSDGATPLYAACNQMNPQVGHFDVIKLLLAQNGIEVNKARTSDGATPLYNACEQGNVDAIKLLLAQDGIEVNKGDANGATPLYVACEQGNVDAIKLLLAHDGIEVNKAKTDDGATPLYIVCEKSHFDAMKLLLAQDGIDVNKARTDNYMTPMHAAANFGNLLAAQHLMICAADMEPITSAGHTAAQLATVHQKHDIVAWLAAIQGWFPLRIAAGCRFHEMTSVLLRQGRVDPDRLRVDEMRAVLDASATASADLLWAGAPPLCNATIKLMTDATRGWHRATHWLHHSRVRESVLTLLIVAGRLEAKGSALANAYVMHAPLVRNSWMKSWINSQFTLLPLLPPEIWFHVMSFFQRTWWPISN